MTLFMLFFLYWNISIWLYGLQLLHPDSGDLSGVHWSVSRVQPSQLIWRLRAISRVQQCFTLLLWLACLVGKKKAAQTTLELCPVTVHQPSKVKLAELWERGERHLSLSRPAHPAGEWQHINKARPPQPPATKSQSSQGLSFTYLISQGVGHRPGCPAPC